MKFGRRVSPTFASLIETLPNGNFAYYPSGKLMFRCKSDRFYIDCIQSQNKASLEKFVRIQLWIAQSGFMYAFFMSGSLLAKPQLGFIATALCIQFLLIAFNLSVPFQVKVLTVFFPNVFYIAQDFDSEKAQDVLRVNRKNMPGLIMRLIPIILFAAIVYLAWTMIVEHRATGFVWNAFISYSPILVLTASFLACSTFFALVQMARHSLDYLKVFVPAYLVLSIVWIGVLANLKGPLAFPDDPVRYDYAAKPHKKEWVGVDWRTEIRQTDEPETWPFIEPSYMLGCQGMNGNFSVYLVRTEDISYKPGRSRFFVPQYYGLKKALPGWDKAESQLLDGQSPVVFEKYVEMSLELCRKAEAAKGSKNSVPVVKK